MTMGIMLGQGRAGAEELGRGRGGRAGRSRQFRGRIDKTEEREEAGSAKRDSGVFEWRRNTLQEQEMIRRLIWNVPTQSYTCDTRRNTGGHRPGRGRTGVSPSPGFPQPQGRGPESRRPLTGLGDGQAQTASNATPADSCPPGPESCAPQNEQGTLCASRRPGKAEGTTQAGP